jgi:hypothetical protein
MFIHMRDALGQLVRHLLNSGRGFEACQARRSLGRRSVPSAFILPVTTAPGRHVCCSCGVPLASVRDGVPVLQSLLVKALGWWAGRRRPRPYRPWDPLDIAAIGWRTCLTHCPVRLRVEWGHGDLSGGISVVWASLGGWDECRSGSAGRRGHLAMVAPGGGRVPHGRGGVLWDLIAARSATNS